MAERVGFEPTARCRVTGFQDRLLKPLGHLSEFAQIKYHIFRCLSSYIFCFFSRSDPRRFLSKKPIFCLPIRSFPYIIVAVLKHCLERMEPLL